MKLYDSKNLEVIDGSFINAFGSHVYDLKFNSNLLIALDLSNSEKCVGVNCSNNPSLSKITFPNSFDPVLFECRDTSLDQVTVSDCQKNTFLPRNNATSIVKTTTTTVTATPTSNNNLARTRSPEIRNAKEDIINEEESENVEEGHD
ncbi:2702_t:CDS:2 [Diversispora eburnea]|uniref:2702_t:CDS:1 n=1 Tax=Diversispora eburnea TaxID=1213867 RepID=A0A9N8VAA8_9GLOM|nr:2702_t:CDS:2 [Diversispora eburnea]